jgi:enoyl-CoA hydratase
MPHPQLLVEDHPAGYRWLRLDRPERRNALDPGLMAAVRDALAAEPGTLAVLGSTDPQVFSAGADLTISDAERAVVSDLVYDCCQTIVTRPGPVIAVITGAAVGGGAQLAAAADFRIAGPGARMRWIGPKNPPGLDLAVGAWVLPDLVGRGAALDITLTGRWVEAAEALALGLVHQVSADPPAQAGQFAASLAARGTGAGVKPVMAAGGLLDRLRTEREANRAAWARVTGVGQRLPGFRRFPGLRLPGLEPGWLAGAPAGDARRGVVRGRTERRYDPGAGRRVGRRRAG